jgi:hypothetical protein
MLAVHSRTLPVLQQQCARGAADSVAMFTRLFVVFVSSDSTQNVFSHTAGFLLTAWHHGAQPGARQMDPTMTLCGVLYSMLVQLICDMMLVDDIRTELNSDM